MGHRLGGRHLIGIRGSSVRPLASEFDPLADALGRPASPSCRAVRRRACSGSSIASAATSSPASGCCTRKGGRTCPASPIRSSAADSAASCPTGPGVEVIGGPYLHASLTTNFTQFGEGKLFGRAELGPRTTSSDTPNCTGRRPSCAGVRMHGAFCRTNPDLIQILEDDGTVLIGRVDRFRRRRRFEGHGRESRPAPGGFGFTDLSPGLDGSVVLRYHSVPCLTTRSVGRVRTGVSGGGSGPFHPLATTRRDSRRRAGAGISRSGVSRWDCRPVGADGADDARKRIA